jgi:hypothetical protein
VRGSVLVSDLPASYPVELAGRQFRRDRLVELSVEAGEAVAASERLRLEGAFGDDRVDDVEVVMEGQVLASAAREDEPAFDVAPFLEGPSDESDGPSVG